MTKIGNSCIQLYNNEGKEKKEAIMSVDVWVQERSDDSR
jgi:hypothetical protein